MLRRSLLLLLLPSALSAQVVRGHILDAATGVPVSGGFIRLQSTQGLTAAETMTDASGLYAVTAKSAGWYLLRLERLGYETVVTDSFEVSAPVTRDFKLPAKAIDLPTIVAAHQSRCTKGGLTPESALLWEEVRKALSVTAWTAQNATLNFDLLSKQLTRGFRRDSSMKSSTTSARGTPFAALNRDSLMQKGFVRKDHKDYAYFAPDAELVLSEPFQQTHCFRGTTDPKYHPGMVGLAFQPDGTIKPVDVKGTLWLDVASKQLASLEFAYSKIPTGESDRFAGGEIRFTQLQNGMYFISEWRMLRPLPLRVNGITVIFERDETITAARLNGRTVYQR